MAEPRAPRIRVHRSAPASKHADPVGVLACSLDAAPELSGPDARRLLGGKGAGLVAMARAGLPVPPGLILTTEAFAHHARHGWDETLERRLRVTLAALEVTTGKRLGDPGAPLLVSVRSGAPVSMPGMMDTVLNVGMTPAVRRGFDGASHDASFARDLADRARESFRTVVGVDPPTDPVDQIRSSVEAVFASWHSDRALTYRRVEGIDASLGTAVVVQSMVFGNRDRRSGTGIAFSRDPTTGERGLMGDFLPQAQGEDVVAGDHATLTLRAMEERWPEQHAELVRIAERLERSLADMVDLEFTIETDRLWLLQVRRGKRSPIATLRIAIDMAEDPHFPVDRVEAVRRCRHLLDDPPTVGTGANSAEAGAVIARGLAASPGAGTGVLCLDPDQAVTLDEAGEPVVLARAATSPADVHGMAVAAGLFTTTGGLVSHAAVVARDWGIPAVVGAGEAVIEADGVRGPGGFVAAGDLVTVDGAEGALRRGPAATADAAPVPEVARIRSWAAELDAQ